MKHSDAGTAMLPRSRPAKDDGEPRHATVCEPRWHDVAPPVTLHARQHLDATNHVGMAPWRCTTGRRIITAQAFNPVAAIVTMLRHGQKAGPEL